MTNHLHRSNQQQAKHTPGPYRYGDFKMSPSIIAADGTRIAELVARAGKGEMDANGNMFAAAPELPAVAHDFVALLVFLAASVGMCCVWLLFVALMGN